MDVNTQGGPRRPATRIGCSGTIAATDTPQVAIAASAVRCAWQIINTGAENLVVLGVSGDAGEIMLEPGGWLGEDVRLCNVAMGDISVSGTMGESFVAYQDTYGS